MTTKKPTLARSHDRLTRILEEAVIEGQLQDPDLAKIHGYPRILGLEEHEIMQLEIHTRDRVIEFFRDCDELGEVPAYVLGSYFLNMALAAMMWQRKRGIFSSVEKT